MTVLFFVTPKFFEGHLDGARIPAFLMMLETLRQGEEVLVGQAGQGFALTAQTAAPTMDAAFASAQLRPVSGPKHVTRAVCQKGQRPQPLAGFEIQSTELILNDPRARQAANQLHELRSGRFGLDSYRLSAPLRFVTGLLDDLRDLRNFDTVYVQSEMEVAFLERLRAFGKARVAVFKNSDVTLKLFPSVVQTPTQDPIQDRPKRFLLPVPPGKRREGEYLWFVKNLLGHEALMAQTTVLAPKAFARHLPAHVEVVSGVEDFQGFLERFACVLVPTKHYTGLNNRVFQAACAGCHLIASPEALMGLIPQSPSLARAPKDFAGFAKHMRDFPSGAVSPDEILRP